MCRRSNPNHPTLVMRGLAPKRAKAPFQLASISQYIQTVHFLYLKVPLVVIFRTTRRDRPIGLLCQRGKDNDRQPTHHNQSRQSQRNYFSIINGTFHPLSILRILYGCDQTLYKIRVASRSSRLYACAATRVITIPLPSARPYGPHANVAHTMCRSCSPKPTTYGL